MKKALLFVGFWSLISSFSLFSQTRWHVNAAATGAATGFDWANAMPVLNDALAASGPGDSIWVAAGLYQPTATADRSLSFEQKSGTVLLGGFDGDETAIQQRDWKNNPTILSGDIGLPNDSTDNSFTIVYLSNPDSFTVFDGFFLRGGIANSTDPNHSGTGREKCGGAMYLDGYDGFAYADVRHCVFENNVAASRGGAIYIEGGGVGSVAPRIMNCEFFNNRSLNDGGAIYRNGGSWAERSPDFGNCLFKKNIAWRSGSGIYYRETERSDTLEISRCLMDSNLNQQFIYNWGGAILVLGGRITGTKLSFFKTDFIGNNAIGSLAPKLQAGFVINSSLELYTDFIRIRSSYSASQKAVCAFFLDIFPFEPQTGKFTRIDMDSLYLRNYDSWGINASTHLLSIRNSYFAGSVEPFLINANQASMENVVFSNDEAPSLAGLLINPNEIIKSQFIFKNILVRNWLISKSKGFFHLHIFEPQFDGDPILFTGITFANNVLTGTPAITHSRTRHFTNCLFAGNEFPMVKQSMTGVYDTIRYINCAFKSFDCAAQPPNVFCGPGLLTNVSDPLFRDTAAHDYRLLPCSPLLNKGTNLGLDSILTDLAGQPRILNGTVDIGAYETEISIENTATSPTSCAGAANGSASFSASACLPLTMAWPGGSSSDSTLTGLAAGQYPLTITDSNGFSKLDTVVINDGPPLAYSLATAPVKCFGDSTGSASFFLFGATQPVDYEWITGDSTASVSNLPAGQFGITATDSLGCAASATVEISQPAAPLEASLPVILPVDCAGEMTGLAEASASGGTPDFEFLWSGGLVGPMQNGLEGGPISLTVTDANGCTDSVSTVILEPLPIQIFPEIQHATGPLNADGQLEIDSISGGTGPFQFIWSNGLAGDSIGGLLPGDYVVSVIDDNGCLDTFLLTVDFIIRTNSLEFVSEINFSPNPVRINSTSFLSIKSTEKMEFSIEIIDEKGAMIYPQKLTAKSGLNSFLINSPKTVGAYFIQLKFANGNRQAIRWIVN